MQIIFNPVRSDQELTLERRGDALVVNGTVYDFSGVSEGALLPAAAVAGDWVAGDVHRKDGILRIPVILPHRAAAPRAVRFPEAVAATQDGPIHLPGTTDDSRSED